MTVQQMWDWAKTHKPDLGLTEFLIMYNNAQNTVSRRAKPLRGTYTYPGGLVAGQRAYANGGGLFGVEAVYVDGEKIGRYLGDLPINEDLT